MAIFNSYFDITRGYAKRLGLADGIFNPRHSDFETTRSMWMSHVNKDWNVTSKNVVYIYN